VWRDAGGRELIESYTITHMAHGTPLSAGSGNETCGVAGPFLLEVGISSSYHIARFFGLAGVQAASTSRELAPAASRPPSQASPPLRSDGRNGSRTSGPPRAFDVGAVITRALRSAGLMKPD
jgi:hypothetical protein